MKILSNNGCCFSLLHIDEAFRKELLEWQAAFQKAEAALLRPGEPVTRLSGMKFREAPITFYSDDMEDEVNASLDEDLRGPFGDDMYIVLPDTFNLDDVQEDAIECVRVVLDDRDFYITGYHKYREHDREVETPLFSFSMLTPT